MSGSECDEKGVIPAQAGIQRSSSAIQGLEQTKWREYLPGFLLPQE